jgi:hypothetical protein
MTVAVYWVNGVNGVLISAAFAVVIGAAGFLSARAKKPH